MRVDISAGMTIDIYSICGVAHAHKFQQSKVNLAKK